MKPSKSDKAPSSEREEWLARTADSKYFYDVKVDLSRNEVLTALSTCKIEVREGEPFIDYLGWRGLCRTDLKDDVATYWVLNLSADGWRDHYLSLAKGGFGGRLYDGEHPRFAVIDSFSDG